MALFRRLFYRKPPDRLLEISERVYGNACTSGLVLAFEEGAWWFSGVFFFFDIFGMIAKFIAIGGGWRRV